MRLMRRWMPVLGAGVLLQTGGCQTDTAALLASSVTGLLASVVNEIITAFVFNAFNVAVPTF